MPHLQFKVLCLNLHSLLKLSGVLYNQAFWNTNLRLFFILFIFKELLSLVFLKFFMKATLLEQMKRDYIHIKQTKALTRDQVERQEEVISAF